MKKKDFKGLIFENKTHLTALQRLVFQNYRKLKEWLKKKSASEQREFINRQHERDLKYLDELEHADIENMKQVGDWQYHENSLILKSQLVCCTLSMSGIEKMNIAKDLFDYLIVDEAC